MVYLQSKANTGAGSHVTCVLYTDAADLKADGILTTDEGIVTCKPGSLAWMDGFEGMKCYDGTAWNDMD